MNIKFLYTIVLLLLLSKTAFSQNLNSADWAAEIASRYYITPNITYHSGENYESKLDVFIPRDAKQESPVPVIIFIHGGGWMGGDKIVSVLHLMPYLEMGFAAVNINYYAGKGTAPAAVKDCRCALRWVIRNAQKYNFDINKLVVTGESAGAHLALTTGMLPESAGFDDNCGGEEKLNVAAIINWYGAADVVDLIEGENKKQFAEDWFYGLSESRQIAQNVSPINYVRPELPPIITIHGDDDAIVPYNQAVGFHKKLDEAKVTNQLITVKGGYHGGFKSEEMIKIYETIKDFLKKISIIK